MFDINDFYPTPEKLANQLFDMIDYNVLGSVKNMLEPSCGSGNLVESFFNYYKKRFSRRVSSDIKDMNKYFNLHCVEIDENLVNICRGKGLNVVGYDFMSFEPQFFYQLIIANVPFSNGCEHALRMIEIQQRVGGSIAFIINAETIRNTYSNNRKKLVRLLQEYNAKIEFVKDAFNGLDSERKTDVEVALVVVNIPMEDTSTIFEREFTRDNPEINLKDSNAVVKKMSKLEQLVFEYDITKNAVISVYTEKLKVDKLLDGMGLKSKIQICDDSVRASALSINDYISKINLEYWKRFIEETQFSNRLPSKLRDSFVANMEFQKNISFSIENVMYFYEQLVNSIPASYEDTCSRVFDELTYKSCYSDNEWNKNIHMYDGWKTNVSYKIGKKNIIRCYHNGDFFYNLPSTLTDLFIIFENLSGKRNTLNREYVDGKNVGEYHRVLNSIKNCEKNIETEFLFIDSYRKGTIHLKYKPEYMWMIDEFNFIVSRNKQWIPSDTGDRKWSDMSKEEQEAIKNFGIDEKQYNDRMVLTGSSRRDYLKLMA